MTQYPKKLSDNILSGRELIKKKQSDFSRGFCRDLHFVSTGFEPSTLLMFQSGYATELNYLVAKNRLAPMFFIFFSTSIDSCLVETVVCQTKLQVAPVFFIFLSNSMDACLVTSEYNFGTFIYIQ